MIPSPSRHLISCTCIVLTSLPLFVTSLQIADAVPSIRERADNDNTDQDHKKNPFNPLNINWDPAPAPEDGPAFSANALRDKSYLPAQIGAIVGAYAFSLVLVAITLLCLAKKRREHLRAASEELEFETEYIPDSKATTDERFDTTLGADAFTSHRHLQHLHRLSIPNQNEYGVLVPNFSYPSPTRAEFSEPQGIYIAPSPISSIGAPGVSIYVDQTIVAQDRAMAQSQLEEMYKYAFEHEEAKKKGITLDSPIQPLSSVAVTPVERQSISDKSQRSTLSKKERNKPASLNLAAANRDEEKTQSRTSSLFSALRSPKKKPAKGMSISSPIMTPQSATFSRSEGQEMGAIPPRHYYPPPPPPVPMQQQHQAPLQMNQPQQYQQQQYQQQAQANGAPLTPDISPQSVQSIDERIAVQLDMSHGVTHNRVPSMAPTEYDPESATSYRSTAPLVGLPASPRTATFHRPMSSNTAGGGGPSLPSSPKPGASFSRPNPPSAVRTGGALPLRAYEPAIASPSFQSATKQTVFERKGPLSPTTGRTPFTAGATPYSPYQPFSPVVPMTPSLVTKEDRKRMKRLVPKTPTLQMVEKEDDVW